MEILEILNKYKYYMLLFVLLVVFGVSFLGAKSLTDYVDSNKVVEKREKDEIVQVEDALLNFNVGNDIGKTTSYGVDYAGRASIVLNSLGLSYSIDDYYLTDTDIVVVSLEEGNYLFLNPQGYLVGVLVNDKSFSSSTLDYQYNLPNDFVFHYTLRTQGLLVGSLPLMSVTDEIREIEKPESVEESGYISVISSGISPFTGKVEVSKYVSLLDEELAVIEKDGSSYFYRKYESVGSPYWELWGCTFNDVSSMRDELRDFSVNYDYSIFSLNEDYLWLRII